MAAYILQNVSTRAAEDYREEVAVLDPVSKARQTEAFDAILEAANKLREAGEIYLPLGGDGDS